jgi:hypothetical protein
MRSVLSVTVVLCLLSANPCSGRSQRTLCYFGIGQSIPINTTANFRNLGGHLEDEVSFFISENFRMGLENSFNFLGMDRHAYPGFDVSGGGQWSFFLGLVGRTEIVSRTGLHSGLFASTGYVSIMQNKKTMSYVDSNGIPHEETELGHSNRSLYYSIGATLGYKLLFVQARYVHTEYKGKALSMIPISVGIRVR